MIHLHHLITFGMAAFALWSAAASAQPFTEVVAFGASGNLSSSSNGPAWVDYVARDLNLRLTNFSVGGSSTTDIGDQVRRYLQCRDGVCRRNPDEDTLIASNDWSFGVDLGLGLSPEQSIANALANIRTLAEAGGKNFILGRMSWIPAYAQEWRNDIPLVTRFQETESQFVSEVRALEKTLGIQVFDADWNSLADRVFADPQAFGFTNVEDALNQATAGEPQEYLWWDDSGHATTVFHRLAADETLAVLARPVPESHSCFLFVIGVFVQLLILYRRGRPCTV